jgi:hypothetical protein
VLPRSAAAEDTPGVATVEENILRVVVLSVLCDFLFCISYSFLSSGFKVRVNFKVMLRPTVSLGIKHPSGA